MSKGRLFSGKIKKALGSKLDPARNQFLDLSNAEPDLGLPGQDNYVLVSDTTGTRAWADITSISHPWELTSGTAVLTLGIDGTINLPETTSPGNAIIQSVYNVQVNANDALWTFGTDGTLTAPGSIVPDADLAYDLGSPEKQWAALYVGTATIHIGNNQLSITPEGILTVNGTATIAVIQVKGTGLTTNFDPVTGIVEMANNGVTNINVGAGLISSTSTGNVSLSFDTSTLVTIATTLVEGATLSLHSLTVDHDTVFNGPVTYNNTTTYNITTNTVYTDNLLEIHAPPTGIDTNWTYNDGKDIGLRLHYYDDTLNSDENAGFVFSHDERKFEFYATGYESSGTFVGNYATIKAGALEIVDDTHPAYIQFNDGSQQTTAWLGSDTLITNAVNALNSINSILTVPGDTGITVYNTGSGTVTISLNTATLMKIAVTALSANTASFATTSGYAQSFNTATLVATAVTALSANTASFATTSGYAQSFNTSTLVRLAVSATNATTASFATTSGFAQSFNTATLVATAVTALSANTASFATTSGYAQSFNTSTLVRLAVSATNATTASFATTSGFAQSFNTATLVATAVTALNAGVTSVRAGTDTAVSSTTGNVIVWSTSTFQSVTNRGNSTTNQIIINNTASTNSTGTGALVVNGGIGVNGGGYFNGVVTATNISIGGAQFDFTSIFNGFNSTDDVNIYGGNLNVVSVTTTTIQALAVFAGYLASVTIGGGDGGITYQNAMNVTAVATGTILVNMAVTGTYITGVGGNSIRRQLNGTTGGIGWYQLNNTTGYTAGSPSPSFTITGRLNTGSVYTFGGTVTAVSFVGTTLTNSVSTTTGALILKGGAGIAKDVWVGGMVTATSVYDAGNRVLTSVNAVAGTGISITAVDNLAPVTSFTINNTGVTSLTAGENITVSASTGSVTISFNNTSGYITTAGVNTLIANSLTNYTTSATVRTIIANSLTNYTTSATVRTIIANSLTGYLTTVTPVAGTGISITNIDNLAPVTSFTINNTGVTSLTGTTALGVSSNTGSVTLTNLGVTSLTAGANITLSASTGSVTVSAITTLYLTSSTFNTATVFTSSTQATSTNTGALQVRGGLGVGGNIYAGAVYDSGARVWTTATLTNNNQLTNGAGYINTASANTLIANSLTGYLTTVTPIAGPGISITAVDNLAPVTSFTINNTGVTSVTAGTGITVSTSTGSVTISSAVTGVTQSINTWTPTLVFATTQGTQTYTARRGNYIKQGNLVQAFFNITISSIGTGAGNFSIGGLPFTSTSTVGTVGSLSIDTMPSFALEGVMKGSVTPSTSTVAVFGWFETSPSSSPLTYRAVTAADLGGTASITGSITYISA
jgi:hypothetical protein